MQYTPNPQLAKKLNIWAWILSVIILVTVVLMRGIKIELPFDTTGLPLFYSILNFLTAVILIFALVQVKAGQIENHKKAIIAAMSTSAVFLVMYVLYHITNEPVKYCGDGFLRYLYFIILITHIVAAAVIFPFTLFTFVRGITYQVEKHRKMARWVFPIWLYVTISGPIAYIMLLPCY
ncbi:MAG: DUF420 domain-containing protein [Saprospiraceae bacterium]|nr:DUF420 domain-containing protein [Bacteroidia bacterium]MBT8229473.1 DUF420 domain-containing protein [Bacteroidia bacterium]NNF20369.1 DUF420 domain-containing protein [Saprospiraceae bacterium]NNK90342.1 DUF420 domain-containing protein [Saprospiraceae bacterium]